MPEILERLCSVDQFAATYSSIIVIWGLADDLNGDSGPQV